MLHDYRISKGPDVGDFVHTVEALAAFARDHGPGLYEVKEHFRDPLTDSDVIVRAWGSVTHYDDGKVAIHIDPISRTE